MDINKDCKFCDMGYARRNLIYRLTENMSRKTLQILIEKNKREGLE